ncbi:MAG: DUF4191 domain-containing protein [Nocardioides sp.]|uniref:DUF4191 domain-containing protein n=1 Tax=Nocardioides sp. TaxID=35761 RepID=UPI0039E662F0
MSSTAPEKTGRIKQYRQSYQIAKRTDPKIGLWTLLAFVVGAVVGVGLFWVIPPQQLSVFKIIVMVLGAFAFGASSALILFSRRAQKAAFQQMEGRPGAALAALGVLRRGWIKEEMPIAFNKQQDMVHRVVGQPGIVLIGEGNPNRLRQMLTSERRKHERVASDVPVHEIVVGNGEGQIPLPKLASSVTKLPKAIKPADITDVVNRLKAIDAVRPALPMPKGPVPTSMKGMRQGMRGR